MDMSAIVRPARAERNPHPVLRYSVALASVAVALVIRLALHPSIPGTLPFATFFVAVAVSAAFGGRGPAILAMVSGYLIGQYFFIPPTHQFALEKFSGPNLASIGLYAFVALTIIFLSHLLRHAKRQAEGSLLQAREEERALEQEVSRRQRAEEALREKEWQLRAAVDGAQLGTWVWDAHAGTVIGNDAMYQMLEIPKDAKDPMEIGRSRLEAEDLEELRRRLAEGLKNRRMELGFRVHVPVGGTRWLRFVGEVMEEGQRTPRLAGVATDVSKQKEVEVALQGAVENLAEANMVLEERVKDCTNHLR